MEGRIITPANEYSGGVTFHVADVSFAAEKISTTERCGWPWEIPFMREKRQLKKKDRGGYLLYGTVGERFDLFFFFFLFYKKRQSQSAALVPIGKTETYIVH
jgi:hypothetical protein